MTILIPTVTTIGGPKTFADGLARYLTSHGHTITHSPKTNYDTLLILAECSLSLAISAKRKHKHIVQRLDGVYHAALPGVTRYTYPIRNLRMKTIQNQLADHIIYQSEFARRMCQTILGKPKVNTTIIHNGVSVQLLAQPPKPAHQLIRLVTAALFRRRDQIEPILAALSFLKQPYELHLYGSHTSRVQHIIRQTQKNPAIHIHGSVAHDVLRREFPQYDMFLFADQSACPNVVLEAQERGLPVVAYNRGAAAELVAADSGKLVTMPPHQPFQDRYPFSKSTYQSFARAIEEVATSRQRYAEAARTNVTARYDSEDTYARYESLLRHQ